MKLDLVKDAYADVIIPPEHVSPLLQEKGPPGGNSYSKSNLTNEISYLSLLVMILGIAVVSVVLGLIILKKIKK